MDIKQLQQLTPSLVPQELVDILLNKTYSEEEKGRIKSDLRNITELCFRNTTPVTNQQPIYVATAGGPGACKSTILESYLANKTNFVYTDPDAQALRCMINTYYQSLTYYKISLVQNFKDIQAYGYAKWRDASNYIATTILNEAATSGYNIAHGTTSTSPVLHKLYQGLKKRNYKIVLLLCYASNSTRIKTLEYRALVQGFLQVATEDIVNKGKAFPEKFSTYFEYADEIQLYWTDEDFVKNGSKLAATYEKNRELVIHDQAALNSFINEYDTYRKTSTISLPEFANLLKKN